MARPPITIQIDKILTEYTDEVKKATQLSINKVAKETVSKLKSSSPKHTGSYANDWASRKADKPLSQGIDGRVVYNKQGQLTHLLEYSHVIRNGHGTYGRTSPGHGQVIHIRPVEEWAKTALDEEIQKRLNK